MARKKHKQHLSKAERARRRLQAIKNFGHAKTTKHRKHSDSMSRRKHRGRSKGSSGFGFAGLDLFNIGLMGAGAGLAGLVGEEVSKLSGNKITGNTAQLAAGVGLLILGKKTGFGKYTTPLAKGILIKTVGDYVEDNVVPKLRGTATATTNNETAEVVG